MIRKLNIILAILTFFAYGCTGPTQISSITGASISVLDSTGTKSSNIPAPALTSGVNTAGIVGTNVAPVLLPASSSTASGEADILKVISARMYSNTAMTIVAILSDKYGNIYNFEGTADAEIWQNVDITMFGKGDLLQKWEGISIPISAHFEKEIGKYLVFNYYAGFAPREVQSIYLDLVITAKGNTLKWSGIMPLTMGADCPCQTQDIPPWEG